MGGRTERCDRCRFWVLGDQWSAESQKDMHRDDRIGGCRRNAPHSTMGDVEYQMLNMLVILAWRDSVEEEQHMLQDWEEAAQKGVSWPQTAGGDWCGEFRAKGKKS